MKVAVILSLVATTMACAADNCARAVTGTRLGAASVSAHQADCSSFQKTVVTPAATTATVTVTVDPEQPHKFKRNAVRADASAEKAVPTYAAACSGAERYASACSCWGITAMTSTAPQPTSTVTVTVTSDYCEDL